jgi:hypothetical protein
MPQSHLNSNSEKRRIQKLKQFGLNSIADLFFGSLSDQTASSYGFFCRSFVQISENRTHVPIN